jgi:hypothetical protein
MADVNLEIVSRFFSLHGFFVKNGEFTFIKKLKTGRTESDDFIYSGEGLEAVQNAVVNIKPWHSQVFFPSLIKSSHEDIFRFLQRGELKKAERALGHPGFKKFLVISKLPHAKQTREKSIELLRAGGADMVFQFPDMLDFLIRNLKKMKQASGDEVSQLLRILDCYGFCGAGQPELFKI